MYVSIPYIKCEIDTGHTKLGVEIRPTPQLAASTHDRARSKMETLDTPSWCYAKKCRGCPLGPFRNHHCRDRGTDGKRLHLYNELVLTSRVGEKTLVKVFKRSLDRWTLSVSSMDSFTRRPLHPPRFMRSVANFVKPNMCKTAKERRIQVKAKVLLPLELSVL